MRWQIESQSGEEKNINSLVKERKPKPLWDLGLDLNLP